MKQTNKCILECLYELKSININIDVFFIDKF